MRGLTWWMDLVTINHRTPVDDLLRFTFLVGCSWVPNRSLELLVGQSGGIWKPVLIAVAVKHILRTRTSNPLGEQEHQTLLKIYFGFCKAKRTVRISLVWNHHAITITRGIPMRFGYGVLWIFMAGTIPILPFLVMEKKLYIILQRKSEWST